MRRIIIVLAVATAATSAYAAMAFFTGRQEAGYSVTGKAIWKCEYQYGTTKFWRAFESFCPPNIEVE